MPTIIWPNCVVQPLKQSIKNDWCSLVDSTRPITAWNASIFKLFEVYLTINMWKEQRRSFQLTNFSFCLFIFYSEKVIIDMLSSIDNLKNGFPSFWNGKCRIIGEIRCCINCGTNDNYYNSCHKYEMNRN